MIFIFIYLFHTSIWHRPRVYLCGNKLSSRYTRKKILKSCDFKMKKFFSARVAASDRKSDGSIFGRKSDPTAKAEAKIFEKPIRFSPIRQYVSLIGLKRIGSDVIFDFFRRIGSDSFLFFVGSEDKNCFRSDLMATLFSAPSLNFALRVSKPGFSNVSLIELNFDQCELSQ